MCFANTSLCVWMAETDKTTKHLTLLFLYFAVYKVWIGNETKGGKWIGNETKSEKWNITMV